MLRAHCTQAQWLRCTLPSFYKKKWIKIKKQRWWKCTERYAPMYLYTLNETHASVKACYFFVCITVFIQYNGLTLYSAFYFFWLFRLIFLWTTISCQCFWRRDFFGEIKKAQLIDNWGRTYEAYGGILFCVYTYVCRLFWCDDAHVLSSRHFQ